jgi:hypothetical protein
MKKVFSFSFFKTMFLLLIVYIINVACFSNPNPFPTPNPSTTKTIYATYNGIIASVAFSTNVASIIQAESHAQTHQNDLEKLVTTLL